jgi:hypothetical protein
MLYGQATAAGQPTYPYPPRVQVRDAHGYLVRLPLLVHWQVTAGGGSVSPDTSRVGGPDWTASSTWTVGTKVGDLQQLTATAEGAAPVTFTAQVVAGPWAGFDVRPDSLTLHVGDKFTFSTVPVDKYGNYQPQFRAGAYQWFSSDPSVASFPSFNYTGDITANSPGTTMVTISSYMLGPPSVVTVIP